MADSDVIASMHSSQRVYDKFQGISYFLFLYFTGLDFRRILHPKAQRKENYPEYIVGKRWCPCSLLWFTGRRCQSTGRSEQQCSTTTGQTWEDPPNKYTHYGASYEVQCQTKNDFWRNYGRIVPCILTMLCSRQTPRSPKRNWKEYYSHWLWESRLNAF